MESQNRISQTSVVQTVGRQTPNNDFGSVMARTVGEVVRTGGALLSGITGGSPVVSAAVSGLVSTVSGVQSVGASLPSTVAGDVGGRQVGSLATTTTGRGDQWDLLEAQRLMNSDSQSFNAAYMSMQNEMQKESRQFNAISNIMKVRHDSAKAAINNIR